MESKQDIADYPVLKEIQSKISLNENAMVNTLLQANQGHIFESWKADDDVAARKSFFHAVEKLEEGYPGGIKAYVENAKKLLADSAAGANPFEGYTPEVKPRVFLFTLCIQS